ncbi:MAG: phosphoenolpyruvate synthase [Bacilli bacterium]|nr:phosphoenolpyruvate synthase [Bacilli bacterium]
MVVSFRNQDILENGGNKAKFLMMMKEAGFRVPDFFVVDKNTYLEEIQQNHIDSKIKGYLQKLNHQNITSISQSICKLFDSFQFQKKVLLEINSYLKEGEKYAVRSSGTKEDLDTFSFAGQYETFLNVEKEDVVKKIIACYQSMFREVILSYFVDHQIPLEDLSMSVIVQKMVDSEYSGICFTVDPVTGNDKTMLIEVAPGLGENIVSGQNQPEQYSYDWFSGKFYVPEKNQYIHTHLLKEMGHTFFDIMKFFGYPCDIEFAIYQDQLYILQARRITKIQYQGYDSVWSTADFKDGGVSATVCTPYMWSLYEYIWEYVLRKYIVDSKILRDDELPSKLGEMFFGRCYWNLSAVKKTMSRVIGYKEKEFDSEYGIAPTYEGDGQTTGVTLESLFSIMRMAIAQNKIVKTREKNAEKYTDDLLHQYYYYKGLYDTKSIKDIKSTWMQLTHEDYLQSESTYFWQIFINTVHQSLQKDSLLKYMDEKDYLTLIGNIDNISHLLPFYDMWEVSRKIRGDKDSFSYWKKHSVSDILLDIQQGKISYYLEDAKRVIDLYGYHSDKELDVTYPCYYEDPSTMILNIKDLVLLDDSYSPMHDQERGHEKYEKKLEELKNQMDEKNYQKVEKKILKIRNMLWWREEFRDVSTRFYYLIRIYTILLGEKLVREKTLDSVDDIWFLKVGDLWDYLNGKIGVEDLHQILSRNKDYYEAYRNYMSENEIGNNIHPLFVSSSHIKGLGANNGTITGIARVIPSFEEIDRLQEGDILVTKFTDTGWTPKFAILSGIITEFGGILCHAAIVSREYGIPCIVSCTGVMDQIEDGDFITMNGTTGEVRKEKKK